MPTPHDDGDGLHPSFAAGGSPAYATFFFRPANESEGGDQPASAHPDGTIAAPPPRYAQQLGLSWVCPPGSPCGDVAAPSNPSLEPIGSAAARPGPPL
eukprot:SAG11_NODE_4200_length_2019_cov_1.442708_2_plen_98_part_00